MIRTVSPLLLCISAFFLLGCLTRGRDIAQAVEEQVSRRRHETTEHVEAQVSRLLAILYDESLPLADRLEIVADQQLVVRRQLLEWLGNSPNEIGRAVCLRFLRSDPSAAIRSAAAGRLTRWVLDQELLDALTSCVEREDHMVRVFACQTLGFSQIASRTDLSRAHAALLSAVEEEDTDKDLSVSCTAARSLGHLRHAPARSRIVGFFNAHPRNEEVAWVCAEALASIGGADETVFRAGDVALTSDNWNIRYFGVRAVCSVSQEKDVPFLILHLPDELRKTVDDMRGGVSDRVFMEMITRLGKLTGQAFRDDVNKWVEWFNANANSHPEWMQPEVRSVSNDLLDEYRALRKRAHN